MKTELNIRQQIKEHLRKREYNEALNFLDDNCQRPETKAKLSNIKQKFQNIENEMNKSSIDNTAYYYEINQVVMDTLDITDEIVGAQDEDWDFIDELVSSLKFNLVAQDKEIKDSPSFFEKKSTASEFEATSQGNTTAETSEIMSKIVLLTKQLNKYEEKELNTTDSEEKAKLRNIIDALNSQISEYSKELKNLS